jgi:two-component system phosphate regulon response regulator PhoB
MDKNMVLVVEDERPVRQMICYALARAGMGTLQAGCANEARAILAERGADLIILDWMLPGLSGLELARTWRREESTRDIPIIMLTAKADEEDTIRGLNTGCDDYMAKPFSPRELVARINAVLRRRAMQPAREQALTCAGLRLDPVAYRVTYLEQPVALGPTEYRLLKFFMTNPDRVYTRNQLLDSVWGYDVYVEDRTVDVHIRRLRKVLEQHGIDHLIQTVRGAGYRFSPPISSASPSPGPNPG